MPLRSESIDALLEQRIAEMSDSEVQELLNRTRPSNTDDIKTIFEQSLVGDSSVSLNDAGDLARAALNAELGE